MPIGISVHLSIKTGIAYAKTQGNKNENPNPVTMSGMRIEESTHTVMVFKWLFGTFC